MDRQVWGKRSTNPLQQEARSNPFPLLLVLSDVGRIPLESSCEAVRVHRIGESIRNPSSSQVLHFKGPVMSNPGRAL